MPETELENLTTDSRIRRTTRAVLARDWTAVVVELVLVVAGILIAIEVDRWNALRVAEHKESYYVEWLLEALDESIELTDKAVLDLERRRADAVRRKPPAGGDTRRRGPAAVRAGVLDLGRWTHGKLIDAPFRELRALGAEAGLTDRELRRSVALFETRWADRSDSVEHVKQLMIDLVTPLLLLQDVQLDGGERRLLTPFSELCEVEAVRAVTQIAVLYAGVTDYSKTMKRDMHELQGAAVGLERRGVATPIAGVSPGRLGAILAEACVFPDNHDHADHAHSLLSAFAAVCLTGLAAAQGADDCSNAEPISGMGAFFSTLNATTDGPGDCGAFVNDVWFRWTAPATSWYEATTCETVSWWQREVIAVYDPAPCWNLDWPIACDDGACLNGSAKARWLATAGNEYLIRIGCNNSLEGFAGSFQIRGCAVGSNLVAATTSTTSAKWRTAGPDCNGNGIPTPATSRPGPRWTATGTACPTLRPGLQRERHPRRL